MRFPLVLAAAFLALAPLTLHAADAPMPAAPAASGDAASKTLGTVKEWSAYNTGSGKNQACYLAGKPAKTLPANAKRGAVEAHVTHRPGENAVNVVNFQLGYTAKPDSDATLAIDGKSFTLFTSKDGAWARDAATDKAVTIALSKGKEAILKATSDRNTASTDTYDLAGFAEVLTLINRACAVKQ